MLQGLPVTRPRPAIQSPAAAGRMRNHRRFVSAGHGTLNRARSPGFSTHNLGDTVVAAGSIRWPLWSAAIVAGLSAWALALSLAGFI